MNTVVRLLAHAPRTLASLLLCCFGLHAEPVTTTSYQGAEYNTAYCGSSSKNLCFPLASRSGGTALLTTEAGGKAYDGVADTFHEGNGYFSLDLDAPEKSSLNVVAARGGTISLIKNGPNSPTDVYWPVVRIDHGDGYFTEYAEFSKLQPGLRVGGVATGAVLGVLDNPNTRSGADHLHFQVRFDASYDPNNPIDGRFPSSKTTHQLQEVRVAGRLIEEYKLTSPVGTATTITFEKPIIEGTATGLFGSPSPACAGLVVCNGLGTDSITWGNGEKGVLTYKANLFEAAVGSWFEFGTLKYTNGAHSIASSIESVQLLLTFLSTDHEYANGQSLSLRIAIENTPNIGTRNQQADYLTFPDYPQFGTFRVYEGATSSVKLLGKWGSLIFGGFGAVDDPANGFIQAVPEPASGALVILGLISCAVVSSRRPRHLQRDGRNVANVLMLPM